MKNLMDIRSKINKKVEETKIGMLPFFVIASSKALLRYSIINSYIEDGCMKEPNFIDISVAVASEKGLFVPVIRDASKKSLKQINEDIKDFALKAKEGSLTPKEMTGGTFSITNGGVFGSLFSTPILNPPQSAILGMHTIKNKPVCIGDSIVSRPMMYVALSYDHRLIDGREAVSFLTSIKEYIENPESLFI